MMLLFDVYYEQCPDEHILYALYDDENNCGKIALMDGPVITHFRNGNHTRFVYHLDDDNLYHFNTYKHYKDWLCRTRQKK